MLLTYKGDIKMADTIAINTSEPTVNKLPDALDALTHTALARVTRGLSPTAGLLAWHDWAVHLAISPGKQRSLFDKALDKQQRFQPVCATRNGHASLRKLCRTPGVGSSLCRPCLATMAF
jgi:hypothetical protein